MKRTLLLGSVGLIISLGGAYAGKRDHIPDWPPNSFAPLANAVDTLQSMTDSGDSSVVQQVYYTTEARKNVTPVNVVYTPSLTRMPVTSFQLGLLGLVPGLQIKQSSGQPGNEGISVTLRGRTPLTIIDGIPRNMTIFDFEGIESVTVLKDAIPMLGVRGADGAILITTKKGQVGKQQITVNAQTSIQKPLQNIYSKPLSSLNYATLYNEAQSNEDRYLLSPRPAAYSPAALEGYRAQSDPTLYPNVNWRDEILKKSSRFDRYTVTATGGNRMARYFVSAEHFNQKGLFKTNDLNTYNTNNDFKSFTIRSNVDINITSKLEGGIYLFGRFLMANNPGNNNTSSLYSSLLTTPNNAYPVFNPNGSLGGTRQYTNNLWGQATRSGYHINTERDIRTDFYLKRNLDDVLPGLWLKARASFSSYVSENNVRQKTFAVFQRNLDANGNESYAQYGVDGVQENSNNVDSQNRLDYQEISLGYNKNVGDQHHFEALLLANRDNAVVGSNLPLTYSGISGRVRYDFREKYLFDVGFGLNGSNRFPDHGDTKYAFFPSVGAGWVLSKEAFLQNTDWLSFLKLNASYGISGADNASYFTYITRYGLAANVFFGTSAGSLTSIREFAIGNKDIGYEKTAKFNVGLQASFFRNQLSYSVDYYEDKTTGALIQTGLNTTLLGQTYPLQNLGKYNYKGLEMELAWRKSVSPAFSYTIGANLTFHNTKVVDIREAYQPYSWMDRTGKRIGQSFGYIAEGLFQSEADIVGKPTMEGYNPQPGDIKYKDLNGDQVINQLDIAPIGQLKPAIFSGLSLGVNFHQFDLNVLGQMELNRQINFSGTGFYEFQNGGMGQAYAHHLDRWTVENAAHATYPRLSIGNNINNHVTSSYWFKNGNFFRLRNFEIGYTLANTISKKVGMSGIRVFAGMTNVFTITSKQLNGVDPEVFSGQYPLQRLSTIGVKIKL